MRAWKFFAAGEIAPFTGVHWPGNSQWVGGGPDGHGVYACSVPDLPYWLDAELWEVELDGPVQFENHQLIAPRGRLVTRVEDWPASQPDFALGCIERTRARVSEALVAAERPADAEQIAASRPLPELQQAGFELAVTGFVAAGYLFDAVRRQWHPALCAYVAANAAAALAGKRGYDEERKLQVDWLSERLTLVAA